MALDGVDGEGGGREGGRFVITIATTGSRSAKRRTSSEKASSGTPRHGGIIINDNRGRSEKRSLVTLHRCHSTVNVHRHGGTAGASRRHLTSLTTAEISG